MIFEVPAIEAADRDVIDQIGALREALGRWLYVPRRWTGLLRRSTMGRAIRGSNSIEGYRIEKEDAVVAAEGESLAVDPETARAVDGYRRAMTHVLQLARDRHFVWSEQVIKSLHFMMLEHDGEKSPGAWRERPVFVYDDEFGRQVYEAPPFDAVPSLMRELVSRLAARDDAVPHLVAAAMAHLNLTMIHPFRDGNGRMARCLQTLVLGCGGTLEPIFSSIEEYLGRHQRAYYDVLTDVGRGAWHPEQSARPFVRFCLRAHYYQAHTLQRRVREGERLYEALAREADQHGFNERTALALWDAAQGFRVVNATYRSAADISAQLASRELTALAEAGLLLATGEKRGRIYRAGPRIRELRAAVRESGVIADPYPDEARAAR